MGSGRLILLYFCLYIAFICKSAADPSATHIIGVSGAIPDNVVLLLQALPEVLSVHSQPQFSIIEASRITLALRHILITARLTYTVEPNYEVNFQQVLSPVHPSRKRVPTIPWNLDRMDQLSNTLNNVYNPPGTGQGITVYILDTGVLLNHSEFQGRAHRVTGWKNQEPCTSTPHGSWVASIVAGHVYGVAKQALIADMKLPNGTNCAFTTGDGASALNYLLHNAVAPFVVVMSWKTPSSPVIDNLCRLLKVAGAVLAVAADNDGSGTGSCQNSPSESEACLVAAAMDSTETRASWSNYGDCVNIFAPGVGIVGAGLSSTTALVQGDGTSASAPNVAGAAAILMHLYPSLNSSMIYLSVLQSAELNIVQDARTTPNLLANLAHPVDPTAFQSPAPPDPPTPTPTPASSPKASLGYRTKVF